MSSVFTSLVLSIFENHLAGKKIVAVLNYLGYEGTLEGRYHLEVSPRRMSEVLEADNPTKEFINTYLTDDNSNMHSRRMNRRYFLNGDDISHNKVEEFLNYIRYQDYTCCYCNQKIETKHNGAWDTEHIIPKDKYPRFLFEPKNLSVSCKDCNQEKSNQQVLKNKTRKTFPKKSEDYLIVHPHFDLYEKHIKILKSSQFYIPKSSKGRKTVETCGLLRFLYKFSEYGNVSLGLKKKMCLLQKDLIETIDPLVENVILSAIEDLAKEGRIISQKRQFKRWHYK
ncbi:MAG: 5-methylcytosine-specific restriction endonuclease McrA [Phenylobacterium sp.]|jgi:5-methylcytosine-specific restriction endonuclease McrA